MIDKGHGREEVRTVYQLPLSLGGKLGEKWTMVESAIAVVRERKKDVSVRGTPPSFD